MIGVDSLVRLLKHRPFRFLLVGGVNTVFGYGAFTAGLALGLSPSVALAAATVAGVCFNFVTSGTFAFGSRDPRRLPAFALSYAIMFIINLVALRVLVALGIAPALAQALLVLPLAALSYILQRDLVFRARHGGRSA